MDIGADSISLMVQFGRSVIPIAEHLAEILLDATSTLMSQSAKGAKKGVELAANALDGHGKQGNMSLKNLAAQKQELTVIPIEREDLKIIKDQLKAYHVDFALQEDALTGNISVHVKARDLARIEQALKGIVVSKVKEQPIPKKEAEAERDEIVTSDLEQTGTDIREVEVLPGAEQEACPASVQPNKDAVWGEVTKTEGTGAEHATKDLGNGYVLTARTDGRAEVKDQEGKVVWSAVGLAGNLEATKRLAERGMDAYTQKESLHLSPERAEGDDFEAMLDKAEEKAKQEASTEKVHVRTPNREKSAR